MVLIALGRSGRQHLLRALVYDATRSVFWSLRCICIAELSAASAVLALPTKHCLSHSTSPAQQHTPEGIEGLSEVADVSSCVHLDVLRSLSVFPSVAVLAAH